MELKLNDDCLLAIFSKLTIVEQFQNVRFVCKRWFHLIQMFFLNRIISLHLAGSQFDLEQFYRGNDQQKFNNSIIISIENFHSFFDLGHTFPRLKSLQLSYRYSVKSQSSKEFKIDRLLNHFIHTLNSLSIDSVPEPYILQQNLWKTIDQMISLSRLELIGLFEPKLVNTWSRLCHLTINDYDGNLVPILCKLNVNKLTHLELDMVRLSSEQLKLVFNSNKYWGNQLIHLKFGTILFDVDDPNDLKRLINLICTHCKRIQSLEMHIPFEIPISKITDILVQLPCLNKLFFKVHLQQMVPYSNLHPLKIDSVKHFGLNISGYADLKSLDIICEIVPNIIQLNIIFQYQFRLPSFDKTLRSKLFYLKQVTIRQS